jgi:cytochrome P450
MQPAVRFEVQPPAAAARERAPGPTYLTPLRFFWEARADPVAYLRKVADQFGDVVRIHAWPLSSHLLVHPDHVKHVLQDHNRNYWKGELIAKSKLLIGDGLFTSEGDFWRRQRRLTQPAFHRQRIEGFVKVMADATEGMLDRWQDLARSQRPFDVMEEMSRLTLDIVGQALFSIDLSGDAAEVGRAMLIALEHLTHQVTHLFPLPLAIPTPRNLRFRRARGELDRVVFAIIAERRRNGGDRGDLLSMLLQARDADTGEGMSNRQLRDEVMTFVLAGHETTAVTLAWTFHLLAQHPEIEQQARREASGVLGQRAPAIADLGALGLTRRIVEEAMRLYPPVPVLSRQALEADEIGGYPIPKDSILLLSPYVTHRHPALWSEPDRFDPSRFLPEKSASRPRFAYFPFGGGPRLCIGSEFAMMEAQVVLAMVLRRHLLRSLPGHLVEPEVRVTLRPRQGVRMTLHDG